MLRKLQTIFLFAWKLGQHKKWLNVYLTDLFHQHNIKYDYTFNEQDIKKIRNYYGIGVPVVIGNMMTLLHGNTMSSDLRKALTAMGAISGLYDDFFDKHYLDLLFIYQLTTQFHTLPDTPGNIQAFQVFRNEILQHVPDTNAFKSAFIKVFEAQKESLKQKQPLPTATLLSKSYAKGGYSHCFYRTALANKSTRQEDQFWYATGELGQLCNDIFGIHQDIQEGIYTFANTCGSVDKLQSEFYKQLHVVKEHLSQLPFPNRNKQFCFLYFSLSVLSRTAVCLELLKRSELRYGHFNTLEWERSDLVVDMEKFNNYCHQFKQYLKINLPAK